MTITSHQASSSSEVTAREMASSGTGANSRLATILSGVFLGDSFLPSPVSDLWPQVAKGSRQIHVALLPHCSVTDSTASSEAVGIMYRRPKTEAGTTPKGRGAMSQKPFIIEDLIKEAKYKQHPFGKSWHSFEEAAFIELTDDVDRRGLDKKITLYQDMNWTAGTAIWPALPQRSRRNSSSSRERTSKLLNSSMKWRPSPFLSRAAICFVSVALRCLSHLQGQI